MHPAPVGRLTLSADDDPRRCTSEFVMLGLVPSIYRVHRLRSADPRDKPEGDGCGERRNGQPAGLTME
ncbi:hypothetical protein ASE36_17470 [Rhizobium sp. Root274]|nr:hypothetical protein ASC71_17500 [Rhizobium sp. Root1240]KRD27639.1 hypothetical protein ASE36_17470 [Rhizobium sp. Root274]